MTVPTDWRRPDPDRRYQLWWCDRSELGRVWPSPSAEEVRAAYDVPYFTHGGADGETVRGSFLDKVRGHLAWRADRSAPLTPEAVRPLLPAPRARVLDIGCGDGGLLEAFRAAGHEVTGVEIDPRAREVARARGLQVHEGTAEALPAELAGRQYDLVIMSHVLEHTTQPLEAARSAAGAVAEGGLLTVEVPNCASIASTRAGATWLWLDVPRHLTFFTPESLTHVIRRAGLTVERTDFTGYCRQLNPPWLSDEHHIHDVFSAVGARDLPRPSRLSAWRLLASTAFTSPDLKYDSVRVTARKP